MNATTSQNAPEIVIYHIGGEGGYGPVDDILRSYPDRVLLVLFEAREDAPEFVERSDKEGPRRIVINACIGKTAGRAKFYVNKWSLSSSMRPPAQVAMAEHIPYGHCHTWAENTVLDREIELDVVSLDDMIARGRIPPPDIISMDAQGSEFDILQGG